MGLLRAHYVGDLGVLLLEERGRGGVGKGRFLDEAADFLGHELGALEHGVLLVGLAVETRLVSRHGRGRKHPYRIPRAVYSRLYTPLKKKTSLATWIGAVPGAIPPLIGWAAARGTLDPTAWALYAIQFLWQIPHFLALSWIYREDYARAGFCASSVADSSGFSIAWQMGATSSMLAFVSLIPYACGLAGTNYLAGALALGVISMAVGLKPLWDLSEKSTRQVFVVSLVYLPSIYSLMLASAK